MRLIALSAFLGAQIALGAAVPTEANPSPAPKDIQKVHDSVDQALSTIFNATDKAKIQAAIGIGLDQLKNPRGQPKKALDQGLSNVLTKADVKKINDAVDATVNVASNIVERDVSGKPPLADHPAAPMPTPIGRHPRGCDCTAGGFMANVIRIKVAKGPDLEDLKCFDVCCVVREKQRLAQVAPENKPYVLAQLSKLKEIIHFEFDQDTPESVIDLIKTDAFHGKITEVCGHFEPVTDADETDATREWLKKKPEHALHSKRSAAQDSSESMVSAIPPEYFKHAQCDCTKLLTIVTENAESYPVQNVYGHKCVDECTKKLDDKLRKDLQIKDYPTPKDFIKNDTLYWKMTGVCHAGCPRMLLDSFIDASYKFAEPYDANCVLGCRTSIQSKLNKDRNDIKPWHHLQNNAPPAPAGSLTRRGDNDHETDDEYDITKPQVWQHGPFELYPNNPSIDTAFGRKECHCGNLADDAKTRYGSMTDHDSKYHRFKTRVWYRKNKECLEACHSAASVGLGLEDKDLNPDALKKRDVDNARPTKSTPKFRMGPLPTGRRAGGRN